MRVKSLPVVLLLLAPMVAAAQQAADKPELKPTTAADAPTRDTSYIDEKGTAHVTRVVPVPEDLSEQARLAVGHAEPDQGPPQSLEERRKRTDEYTARAKEAWSKICPVTIAEQTIEGVPVHVVTPDNMPFSSHDRLLINLHGGGFNSDSGSYTESIPIASYTKIKVIAVLYRLAPEHPFPAAVDDAVKVYKAMLTVYKPEHIVIYGTSAGAILTAEVAVKLKQLGLPQPGGTGHFQRHGRLRAAGRLDRHVWAARPGRASRSARTGRARSVLRGLNRRQGPSAFAHLRRSARHAAHVVHHQRPRPAAERHGQSAPRLSARGRGRAAGGV